MRRRCWVILLAVCAWAQNVPAGWQPVKARFTGRSTATPEQAKAAGNCRMAVPADWTADNRENPAAATGGAYYKSPDRKSDALLQAHAPGQSFARAAEVEKLFQKASKPLEDSPRRLWLSRSVGGLFTAWTVLVPGTPVCSVSLHFEHAAAEATARKIVGTLAAIR